jgi:hypothetical protein
MAHDVQQEQARRIEEKGARLDVLRLSASS